MYADLTTGMGRPLAKQQGERAEWTGRGGPERRSFEKLDVKGTRSVVSEGQGGAEGVRSVVSGAGRLHGGHLGWVFSLTTV